jgi:hypothetical protein
MRKGLDAVVKFFDNESLKKILIKNNLKKVGTPNKINYNYNLIKKSINLMQ